MPSRTIRYTIPKKREVHFDELNPIPRCNPWRYSRKKPSLSQAKQDRPVLPVCLLATWIHCAPHPVVSKWSTCRKHMKRVYCIVGFCTKLKQSSLFRTSPIENLSILDLTSSDNCSPGIVVNTKLNVNINASITILMVWPTHRPKAKLVRGVTEGRCVFLPQIGMFQRNINVLSPFRCFPGSESSVVTNSSKNNRTGSV